MKKFFLILLISVALSGPRVKSLLVPGWGEFSLDKQSRGKIFLCTESVLIISAFSFNNLSNSYKTDYTAYAAQHANVDLSNEDYLFALDVGNNDNIYDFNNLKRRQRSLLMDVDNQGNIIREYGHEIYPEGGKYSWDWDSETNRSKFNSMRIKSINYEKYTGFVIAGMLLNRVISLIDVMLLENQSKSKISSIVVPKGYDGMELQLYIKF